MRYSDTLIDHFRNPRNSGMMREPDGVGEGEYAQCMDLARFYLRVRDGRGGGASPCRPRASRRNAWSRCNCDTERYPVVGSGRRRTVGAVQRRRELPTRLTQRLQIFLQDRVISRVLSRRQQPSLPLLLRLMRRWPFLRRIPARVVGIGFRPEHVKP